MTAANLSELRDRFLREDHVVIEGRFAVTRALQCGYVPELIVTTEETLEVLPSMPAGTAAEVCSRHELSQISGYDFHRGCLALGPRPPEATSIDAALTRLSETRQAARRPMVLLLEHIADPQNMGVILRTAHALRVDQVFVSREGADPWSRRVIRTSMANVYARPPVIAEDLEMVARQLHRALHMELVAAALRSDAQEIQEFQRSGAPLGLMLGNEGAGLSVGLLQHADAIVKIPMEDAADSLNVAVAAGIFIHRLR